MNNWVLTVDYNCVGLESIVKWVNKHISVQIMQVLCVEVIFHLIFQRPKNVGCEYYFFAQSRGAVLLDGF